MKTEGLHVFNTEAQVLFLAQTKFLFQTFESNILTVRHIYLMYLLRYCFLLPRSVLDVWIFLIRMVRRNLSSFLNVLAFSFEDIFRLICLIF